MNYKTGDQILLRNYKKKSKLDPDCLLDKFAILEVLAKGYILLLQSLNSDKGLLSHPNDVKIFEGDIPDHNAIPDNSDNNNDWKKVLEFISNNDHVHYDHSKQNYCNYYNTNPIFRQSERIRKPNPRYHNSNFVT